MAETDSCPTFVQYTAANNGEQVETDKTEIIDLSWVPKTDANRYERIIVSLTAKTPVRFRLGAPKTLLTQLN
jgi:hypothetical protein